MCLMFDLSTASTTVSEHSACASMYTVIVADVSVFTLMIIDVSKVGALSQGHNRLTLPN